MNSEPRSIGKALELAFARAEAELRACRDVLSQEVNSMPSDYSPLDAFSGHLIEALDAVIGAAGVAGDWRKAYVLKEAVRRHGFEVAGPGNTST